MYFCLECSKSWTTHTIIMSEAQKKLEERNIAFDLYPDGYWIAIIENSINKKEGVYNFTSNKINHTMVRVGDPEKTLDIYRNI